MKILLIDIETMAHRAYVWGLFRQNVGLNQIEEPGYTMCFAAKWYKQPGIIFHSMIDGFDEMIQAAHDLVDEADAVVHYNGKKFDMPTLNKEFLLQGLAPPSPHKDIDLLHTARQRFKLASNKLDFVATVLGVGSKIKHKGMDLWRECADGDEKAWNVMRRYNIQDVRILEKVYTTLLPWIKNHPNHALYKDASRPICTNCGSHHVQSRGIEHTKTMSYRRFQCQKCQTWMRGRQNINDAVKKANTLISVS